MALHFPTDSREYPRETVYFLASLNHVLFYDDNAMYHTVLDVLGKPWSFINRTFGNGNLHTFMVVFDDMVILAIEGTRNMAQLVYQIMNVRPTYRPDDYSEMTIPVGKSNPTSFDYAVNVFGTITSDLLPYYANRRVIMTGHSLGGAIAQHLAKIYLANAPRGVHSVYSFGSPAIGDGQYVANNPGNCFLMENVTDIVPQWPPYYLSVREDTRRHRSRRWTVGPINTANLASRMANTYEKAVTVHSYDDNGDRFLANSWGSDGGTRILAASPLERLSTTILDAGNRHFMGRYLQLARAQFPEHGRYRSDDIDFVKLDQANFRISRQVSLFWPFGDPTPIWSPPPKAPTATANIPAMRPAVRSDGIGIGGWGSRSRGRAGRKPS